MEDKVLRRREKQLARATKTLREVAEELERLALNGPMVLDATDLLPIAAKLFGTRKSILNDRAKEGAEISISTPAVTWEQAGSDVHVAD